MEFTKQNNLRLGVSGMMRVKNEGQFIEACVESCIDALDELIIVWNDCTDNSAEEIEKMRLRYPDKIKTFEYKYKIYSVNLTKEEYEYAKSLPKDSPHLLCNYYNFCLSMVSCQYAVKIDADQIYFTEQLKYWCDVARSQERVNLRFSDCYYYIRHRLFGVMCGLSRFKNKFLGKSLFGHDMSEKKIDNYTHFSKYMFKEKGWNIMLSGQNVVSIDNQWYTTLGESGDRFNLLPPFNGIGDHAIFKVTPECRYEVIDLPSYSLYRSDSYTLIEIFVCNAKAIPVGFFWWHINMMRPSTYQNVLKKFQEPSGRFVLLTDFLKRNAYSIDGSLDYSMSDPVSRLFGLYIYPYGKSSLKRNILKLENLKL